MYVSRFNVFPNVQDQLLSSDAYAEQDQRIYHWWRILIIGSIPVLFLFGGGLLYSTLLTMSLLDALLAFATVKPLEPLLTADLVSRIGSMLV